MEILNSRYLSRTLFPFLLGGVSLLLELNNSMQKGTLFTRGLLGNLELKLFKQAIQERALESEELRQVKAVYSFGFRV